MRTRWIIAVGIVDQIEVKINETEQDDPRIRLEVPNLTFYALRPSEAEELEQALVAARINLAYINDHQPQGEGT